ncbi:hypothetical protein Dda_1254 [Drechslerella dactyloides]|uniref:DASH complex subunit DAD2 n=1 Tax=Drechslerella dactyloides TaxID=74499 RepID=A0AAD6J1H2_DREDA|nr:hypothetical protein Dda_1254 [Drechslerella dactyloides]
MSNSAYRLRVSFPEVRSRGRTCQVVEFVHARVSRCADVNLPIALVSTIAPQPRPNWSSVFLAILQISTPTMPTESDLKAELESLRVLRATLESVRQFVDVVENDVNAMGENARTVTDLSRRWSEVLKEAAVAVGEVKPKAPRVQR